MDFDEVADELYSLLPEKFIPARKAREDEGKANGDRALAKEIGALPKPSTAAWVCNALVRHHPDEIAALVDLGGPLREAQQNLAGDRLRQLSTQRHQLIAALTRQAQSLARELGRPVSSSVAGQVEGTLRAAMADVDAGQALLSGRLTAPLSYSGLGMGQRPDLRLVPPTRPVRAARAATTGERSATERGGSAAERRRRTEEAARWAAEDQRRRELTEARQAAEEAVAAAEEAAAEAEEAAEDEGARADEFGAREESLRTRIDELTHELARLREEYTAVGGELARAQRRRQAAEHRRRAVNASRDHARALVVKLAPPVDGDH